MRLDDSDGHVFDRPAAAGEWAVPGGFEFADWDLAHLSGKQRFAFSQGFLGLSSFGRSTVTVVATASAEDRRAAVDALADHLMKCYGAPGRDAALAAAEGEIAFAEDLCRDFAVNRLLLVERDIGEDGAILEQFRSADRPGRLDHTKIWTLVPDDTADRNEG